MGADPPTPRWKKNLFLTLPLAKSKDFLRISVLLQNSEESRISGGSGDSAWKIKHTPLGLASSSCMVNILFVHDSVY